MDADRFDRFVASLSAGTRRTLFGLLTALPLAGGLVSPRDDVSEAARRRRRQRLHDQRKKKKKKKCAKVGQAPNKKRKQCCQGLSPDGAGFCAAPSPPGPPPPPLCVCASGCPFTAAQAAIDAAAPGAIVTVCAGVFPGTIEIAKNLTLIGAGDGAGPGTPHSMAPARDRW